MVAVLKKDLDELIQHLHSTLNDIIKHDTDKITRVKNELKKFKVLPGVTQNLINNGQDELEKLKSEDRGLLYLFTNAVYLASGNLNLNPQMYFNEREIKEIKTTYQGYENEPVEFPYTFHNVLKGTDDNFLIYSDAKTAKFLYDNKLLQYNKKTQRETRQKKNSTGYIEVEKIVEKSVREIAELVEKGQMITSMFTLNARQDSADSGDELFYNDNDRSLTINKGTLLDILDGFHRLNGIMRALNKDETLNTPVIFNIINYDEARAIEQFSQINTTNPVDKGHLKKMSKKTYAPTVLEYIKYNSDIKNYISNSVHIAKGSELIVSENVLLEAIEEVYDIQDKPMANEIAKYLAKFIDELMMCYPDAFYREIIKFKDESLVNANVVFYGYVLLSKRMKDEGIKLNKLSQILSKIDLSRDNEEWRKLKILNDDLNVSNIAKQGIYKFFENIKLK